jgi:thioredoxin-dependent peroxiredoxin
VKLFKYVLSVIMLAMTLAGHAAPKIKDAVVSVSFTDGSSIHLLSAITVNKRMTMVDLDQAKNLFEMQVIVPAELPLIVLATNINCVPILLNDVNSYLGVNGRNYISADSMASAVGCRFVHEKKRGGEFECGSFDRLIPIGHEIGDRAPGFQLSSAKGETMRFDSLLEAGALLIAFIRSADWEPFSRDLLTRLNANVKNFAQEGVQPVVIHGYDTEAAKGWQDSLKIEIPLLSDDVSAVMRAYGVHQKGNLPQPSIFILDSEGIIRFKHVYGDETKPPDMMPILEGAKAVKDKG